MIINVTNLSFTYSRTTTPILKNLNFTIESGEIFGFLGPSGAGKSTCQRILFKILRNYSGEIKIDGKDLQNWDHSYFERIGVGFEYPNHYGKLTARENLELFSAFYPKDNLIPIPILLEIVGLQDDINKRVESYSKGMKMRLNFVRSIMHNPDILFFDEPTAGLDPGNAQTIKNHILGLKKQGKTIFITTHDMITADQLCDRVSFLVDGEIIVTEKPSVLKIKYGEDKVKVDLKNGRTADFALQGLGLNKQFLQFIETEEILKIHTKEATLEKVFIHVTGKSLKE